MSIYRLIDDTLGRSWDYDSAAQLRAVARLYRIQHPTHTVREVRTCSS